MLEDVLRGAIQAVRSGAPADRFITDYFRHHRELGARDRRFISDAVFSYFRWLGWVARARAPDEVAAVLLAAALDHELSEEVIGELTRRWGREFSPENLRELRCAGLAQKAERLAALLNGVELPVNVLFPAWFWEEISGPAEGDPEDLRVRVAEALQLRPPVWLRAARGQGEKLVQRLRQEGLPARRSESLPDAVAVEKAFSVGTLQRRIGLWFEVQDLASQCVVEVLGARPGERIWDACAGSGGKSLAIAEAVGAEGWVVLTDRRRAALQDAQSRLQRAGKENFSIVAADLLRSVPCGEVFDAVLVDAPCTGSGTWGRNPDARWRTPAEAVAAYAGRQLRLLEAVAGSVKAGGRLCYAVCSLTRSETVEVIRAFLAVHREFVVEPVPHPLVPGQACSELWFMPWAGPNSGMFACRLRRR